MVPPLEPGRATLSPRVGVICHTHPGQISGDWEAMHIAHLNVARSFAGADWWSRGLVERRAGVTAWDRFRDRQRAGAAGAGRQFARDLAASPPDTGGGRGAAPPGGGSPPDEPARSSGEPSIAMLAGDNPAAVPEKDRYEVDLSATSSLRAFIQLARRPSGAAIVSSRSQAALVRLARVRPIRALGFAPPGGA